MESMLLPAIIEVGELLDVAVNIRSAVFNAMPLMFSHHVSCHP